MGTLRVIRKHFVGQGRKRRQVSLAIAIDNISTMDIVGA
jgi:hypothetical protein